MNFKEYLKRELEKPVNNEHYNPDGNSNRAVVARGLWGEIAWQYKAYPKRLLTEIKCFNGLSTELGWFLQLPLMILLSPIAPILAAKHWHNKSLGEYKLRYNRSKNKNY